MLNIIETTDVTTSGVMTIITSYELNNNPLLSNNAYLSHSFYQSLNNNPLSLNYNNHKLETATSISVMIQTYATICKTYTVADEATSIMLKIYDTVYNSNFDTTFDTTSNTAFNTTQTITSTSHVFPFYDIDSLLPIVYAEISSTSNNERSSVAVTTKIYELLHATFILILTSLLLLNSNLYINTVSC